MDDNNNVRMHMANVHIPPVSTSGERIRKFDCAICGGSLEKEGPALQLFSFGKLLTSNQLSLGDQDLIFRQFFTDPCYRCGTFDCTKVITTPCGHLFHSGCIREWFFTRRYDRHAKCPFCNQRANYDECIIIHPLAIENTLDENSSDEDVLPISDQKPLTVDLDYSDISCASSSYSTDEEDFPIELEILELDDPLLDDEAFSNSLRADIVMARMDICNELPSINSRYQPDDDLLVDLERVERDLEETTTQLQSYLTSEDNNLPVNPIVETPPSPSQHQPDKQSRINLIKLCNNHGVLHFLLLMSVFIQANATYKDKLSAFQKSSYNTETEDDNLEIAMIPLGYDFIAQMMWTGMAIMGFEGNISMFMKIFSYWLTLDDPWIKRRLAILDHLMYYFFLGCVTGWLLMSLC